MFFAAYVCTLDGVRKAGALGFLNRLLVVEEELEGLYEFVDALKSGVTFVWKAVWEGG